MLFSLFSIMWYLKSDVQSLPKPYRSYMPRTGRWYWMSLTAFVIAMLSKGSAAVLPMLIIGIIWWQRTIIRWDLLRTAPYFTITAALTIVNIRFQTHGFNAIQPTGSFERILRAGSVVWFYLYKSLLPINLVFVYPQWHIQTNYVLWWLPLLAATAVTIMLYVYRRTWSRPFLFAWGFFCVALVPVMGLTDLTFMRFSLVADHYQHVAIIGTVTLVAAGWTIWHRRSRRKFHYSSIIVSISAIAVLALLTLLQSRFYGNAIVLYKTTLEKNPGCWVIHNNLGLALSESGGHPDEEVQHYEQALCLKPDYAEAHNNLGSALEKQGRISEAIEHYRQALHFNPDFFMAHYNLASVFFKTGQKQEAIEQYQLSLQIKPDFPEAHNDLGSVLAQSGRLQEGIEHFKQAVRLNPYDPMVHNNLGNALLNTGQLQGALEQYQKALQYKPDFVAPASI